MAVKTAVLAMALFHTQFYFYKQETRKHSYREVTEHNVVCLDVVEAADKALFRRKRKKNHLGLEPRTLVGQGTV